MQIENNSSNNVTLFIEHTASSGNGGYVIETEKNCVKVLKRRDNSL